MGANFRTIQVYVNNRLVVKNCVIDDDMTPHKIAQKAMRLSLAPELEMLEVKKVHYIKDDAVYITLKRD